MLLTASVLFMLVTVPAFMLLDTGNFLVIVLVQILLGGMLTLNDGTLPSFLAELFPTKTRYSGFAVSFNLSNALFGGTAPFMATLLIGLTHNKLAPGWYLVAASLVSLIAVLFATETSKKPLQQH
jgi:MHS family proline/betaine transporter-like MFS transporter